MLRRCPALLFLAATLQAAAPTAGWISDLTGQADLFAEKAIHTVSQETLVQRSYTLPPHAHFTIGAAAQTLFANYFVHEIVSAYSIGRLKGDQSGNLLEYRELVSMDGKPLETPEVARKALALDIKVGEERIRKKILGEFTKLGLVDVATDYGLILLAFTSRGQSNLVLEESGSALVGTDDAIVLNWKQTSGGALEFRGSKAVRRPMHGSIWLRKSDGAPLRITASIEHAETNHYLRDDASVDYVASSFGCVTPATVVHRHLVDGVVLTENLYSYDPFRMFTTDTNIEYIRPPSDNK